MSESLNNEQKEHTEQVLDELSKPFKKYSEYDKKRSRRLYGSDFDEHPITSVSRRSKKSKMDSVSKKQKAILHVANLTPSRTGLPSEKNGDHDERLSEYHKQDAELYMDMITKSAKITPEMLVEEIAKIAFTKDGMPFANEGDYNGKLNVSIKDKLKALDMLSKWAGLYERDNAQKSAAAASQMLQITFIGSDVVDEVQKKRQRIAELSSETIWDAETAEKTSKALANAIEQTNEAINDDTTKNK